ncbi:MAG: FeoB-associated Cys-rich membrane protein [Eubacteriales bacterium]|nr:FeoB-associated Cys-rich membrane protein [Eubacteriales bacterium]
MADLLSAAIVLFVFVGIYAAVSYMYRKRKEGFGCCGDCSRCSSDSECKKDFSVK